MRLRDNRTQKFKFRRNSIFQKMASTLWKKKKKRNETFVTRFPRQMAARSRAWLWLAHPLFIHRNQSPSVYTPSSRNHHKTRGENPRHEGKTLHNSQSCTRRGASNEEHAETARGKRRKLRFRVAVDFHDLLFPFPSHSQFSRIFEEGQLLLSSTFSLFSLERRSRRKKRRVIERRFFILIIRGIRWVKVFLEYLFSFERDRKIVISMNINRKGRGGLTRRVFVEEIV